MMSEKEKSGVLKKDETWSGEIYVVGDLVVPKGITLTIKPGTVIKVRHSRDYRKPEKVMITAEGGTIKAVGNPKERIWFTSDAKKPMHYDWHGVWLQDSSDSKFDYVIVEFGEIGIIMFNSDISVTNSIVRWNATEGVYAEYSSPVIQNNRIYQNGYHEVNGEQYNKNYIVRNNIIGPGYMGMNCEKSTTHAEGNYFIDLEECAIVGSHEGHYTIVGNKFKNVGIPPIIRLWDDATAEVRDNDYGDGHIPIPKLDYEDIKVPYELGYNPGDPQDEYLYVFPHVDETRKVVKKIKAGHFGFALTYRDGYLWRFALPGTPGAEIVDSGAEVAKRVGKKTDFMQIDPDTGNYRRYGNDWILNPRGLTNDGEYFWVNDFSYLKIFKFKLDGKYIEIIDSFDIPEKEKGGVMGLTSDGKYLYLKSRDGKKIYKLDKEGSLVDEIVLKDGVVFERYTPIVWIDHYFWGEPASRIGIGKFTEDGKMVGKINLPAREPFAITWDGKYLWTIQRTCESWYDPKIYKTLILNDFLEPPPKIPLPRSVATTPPEVIYGKEVESFEAD